MAKVTSKLQVTIPKQLAEKFGIRPGDDIEWSASADAIRLSPQRAPRPDHIQARLRLFDQAMSRRPTQKQHGKSSRSRRSDDRGWKREDLYTRGRTR